MEPEHTPVHRVETGVKGLDYVLSGGLPAGHVHLIEGAPGAGKTTLALQFLLAGRGEGRGLVYITLSQTREELEEIAASHGFDLSQIDVLELLASEIRDRRMTQTVVSTAEEELEGLINTIEELVDERRPSRIVIDSLTELRLVSTSMLRFRRSILSLNAKMAAQHATTLLIDGLDELNTTGSVELMTHGTIRLDWRVPDYGIALRRLQVVKMRGSAFMEGYHDLSIETGGVTVYPRIVTLPEPAKSDDWQLKSGDRALDALIGGGLPGNGTTLLSGVTGTGKSVLATLFAHNTAVQGKHTALFLFEELEEDFLNRSRDLGMDLRGPQKNGLIAVEHFDPTEISQGQLFNEIYLKIGNGARLIIIDSLTGFVGVLSPGRGLLPQFNSLLNVLKRQNVSVLMTLNASGVHAHGGAEELDFSFLADNVMRLSLYQSETAIGRSVRMVKKRYGPHSGEVRTLHIEKGGVTVTPIEDDFRFTGNVPG